MYSLTSFKARLMGYTRVEQGYQIYKYVIPGK